ncbi:hypothetical protein EXIGLDRAFT_651422 [Exidia glandulosa HHB12029]|uniref:Zn(2)-C6 fungal-type domain-containing protein n=1 Tax=Exidia glandulosa HHB12029 TaxID=1314781 RepID=A0A165F1X9_EXIGL|nr:hypothetical protein EXIGLDRAFT_651422 [Exidia glandulosa HHB12029]
MQSVFSQYADPNDTSSSILARPPKQRRRREVLACAECRRLKLKCDRQWPCSTCKRRGCASICPSGSMAAGKAGRLILANTSSLHERIAALCERVRSLEDALEKAAGLTHPLLSDELRELKAPLQGEALGKDTTSCPSMDATGSTEDSQDKAHSCADSDRGVSELLELGRTFPQPLDEEDLINAARSIQDIRALLPASEDAQRLVDSFYGGFGSTYEPTSRATLDRILKEVYDAPTPRTDLDYVHKLALLLVTFALADFHDVHSIGLDSASSETYFYLAKALMCIRSCIESTNVVTVLVLLNIVTYCRLTNRNSSAWTLLGLAGRLVVGNGLHRNPERWGFDAETSNFRQTAFWELYSFDTLFTMAVQRAPMYNIAYVDCPFPQLDVNSNDPLKRTAANCVLWKYRYTSEIIPRVLEELCGRKPSTYTSILETDKAIRESWIPDCLQLDRQNPLGDSTERTSAIQRFTILWNREMALMFLHRMQLAIALTESPDNLLQHRFSPSVLASFRSAYKLSTALRALAADPATHGSHVCFYQPGYAAATVLGSIAIISPQGPFGASSTVETLKLCDLYEKCPVPVPSKVIVWLRQLKEKLLHNQQQGAIPAPRLCAPEWDQFGDDERLISTRVLPSHIRKEVPPPINMPNVFAGVQAPTASDSPPFADLFALNDSLDNSLFMNEPLSFNYFPPTEQPSAPAFPPPPSQEIPQLPSTGLFAEPLNYPAGPLQEDMEVGSQWERFLASIGLSDSS